MKNLYKYLVGIGISTLGFGTFGTVTTNPEVQLLGEVIESKLTEYQAVRLQVDSLDSIIKEIETELAILQEDYIQANELFELYNEVQVATTELSNFDTENYIFEELSNLQDAQQALTLLEEDKSNILPLYESAKAENDIMIRADRLGLVQAFVTNIVDGDTIDVTINGASERVRFIGIDTPERGQNGFNEASEFTRNEIARVGDIVWLQSSGANRDNTSSRRLRRYIWLGVPSYLTNASERAELNLNQRLLDNGHAVTWTPGGNTSTTNNSAESVTPSIDTSNEVIVYWTVNGSVWHRNRNCRGLNRANDRNVRSGTIAQSGKYRECQHSARGN